MKVFLCIGQSNMAGPKITGWDQEDDDRLQGVLLSNDINQWIPAKNPINGFSTVRMQAIPGLNPVPTFVEMVKKAFPGEEIGLVSNARGSSKIKEWQKGERYFEEAVRRVKAVYGNQKIAGILWLQGEQDVVEECDYSVYAERFSKFIFDIRNELGGQDIPFIACEIWGGEDYKIYADEKYHKGIVEVNRQIKEVVEKTENCGWISSQGVAHTVGDEVHFAKEGMRELGYRFANEYLEKWGNKMKKQFKIGVIGTENFHAKEFTGYFNKADANGEFMYPDCHVTYVFGHYPEENEKLVNEFNADMVASNIEEMVKSVDAVMITARDGKFHAEFARPFIEAGIPAFIDKPFTCDTKEALELVKLAKEKGVPLCGGSSLKYSKDIQELRAKVQALGEKAKGGYIAAPLQFNSEYSGFWFYASHAAEMCLETFGWQPKSVFATEKNGSVQAIVEYENYSVVCSFVDFNFASYTAVVFGVSDADRRNVSLDGVFQSECSVFVEMLRKGTMEHSYEQLIAPVLFLDAVKRSYETGKKVEIVYEEI